jgi:esterase/lipase superfamily enzyme
MMLMMIFHDKLSTKLISNTVLKHIHLISHVITKLTLFSLDQLFSTYKRLKIFFNMKKFYIFIRHSLKLK